MLKSWRDLGTQETHLNTIKVIYTEVIDKIKFHIETNLKKLHLNWEQYKLCHPLHTYLISTLSLNLNLLLLLSIKQQQGIQIGKEEINVSLFTDNMIVFINDTKNSTTEVLQLTNSFKIAKYKIN